ncbi:MAG: VWA domain-containing protein [Nitrospirae bacterium]|nr:VWA domain-containing protein [Nitrospirota bacterium]
MTQEDKLIARLAGSLTRAVATELVAQLVQAAGEAETVAAVLALLDELEEASPKAAQGAVEALPELQRRDGLAEVVSWLDLGVALAQSSGAAAMKYFKESPLILGLIESGPARRRVLALALELADSDPNIALEFLRKAPELLAVLPADQLGAWADLGVELARFDYVLGIEFFRQCFALARVIPFEQVRAWVAFGMKLITRNSLGKTDYLGTLEFFRASPAILGDIEGAAVRKSVVELGSTLADRAPQAAISFLAESPSLLRRMFSEEWRLRVLRYGVLTAEKDAEAALAYVRRCPEILTLIATPDQGQDNAGKFEDWFKGGMEVLAYSVEGARAYFALETKKALASVEQAMSGVPLRQIARSLKLFAQGLCGTDVTIRALPDPPEPDAAGKTGKESVRATVSPDGRTIALPAILRRYPSREQNVRLYTVMTAHEAGHLEFGTYSLPLGRLADLIVDIQRRYGRPHGQDGHKVHTLEQIFALYPQPGLIRDLWTVLEDARVEYRLQHDYPGLRRDLAELAKEAVTTRSFLHGLSVREMVVDALLLLSTVEPGTVRVPDAIAEVVERIWALSQTILTPSATAEEAVRLADRVYVTLDEMLATVLQESDARGESAMETEQGAGPKASEEISGEYRPVTNWAYRGAMNPDMVRDRGGAGEEGGSGRAGGGATQTTDERRGEVIGEELVPGVSPRSAVEQMLAVGDDRRERREVGQSQDRAFLYDEWDGLIQDYRSGWCRVIERMAPEGTADFAEATLAAHGPSVRLLRRYFESIRPSALRRVHGQTDGEDLDLDAAIGRTADRMAGAETSDRIYVRREKRERAVATAFLVDMSGSTSRQIESDGRRVVDVEKEGLVLLCEALEAIGDQYAIYGYSGQGRHQVDFVVVKDFEEPAGGRAASRIGAVAPLHQNRDGAAIRHTTRKLLARPARVRLLILISDGKPLDEGYAEEYSLEDTKMALREARMQGIEPFCITVDRDADDYLRRMYGEVRFLIIDHAGALPERLPRVYQQLTRS